MHADFVGAFDHYVANEVLVTANHALAADDVAIRVNRRERSVDCRLGVDERREHFVVDFDCRERAPRSLGMISCNSRHGFAGVSHNVAREHRLVARDEAVGQLAGHVVGGDHRRNTVDGECRRHVDGDDARMRMRTAQRRTPEHVVGPRVGGEGEASLHFGDAVGSQRRGAESVADARVGTRVRARRHVSGLRSPCQLPPESRRWSRTSATAAKMRP